MASLETRVSADRQRILVIDDELSVCISCSRILASEGHEVECRRDAEEGLSAALSGNFDVILLDLVMPRMNGLEVLTRIKAAGVTSEVMVITGYSTVQDAVTAMREGAVDFVSKPFTPEELLKALNKLIERSTLIRENLALRRELDDRQGFQGMIIGSRAMESVVGLIRRVAPTQGTVLITGESGTGKEMVARAVHHLSSRRDQPFLACDCSSLAPSLLESELFGHLKGSFTGAVSAKQGLFEAADQGTLFLDEISNISLEIQGKLLRALESRRVKPVGDTNEKEVDIRLIAATNRDLLQVVREKSFREDLYFRLNVVPINVPPLRERHGDIPLLAMTFLERFRKHNQVKVQGFTPEAMRLLESYAWPGNVRELKNIVERIAILCDSERVEAYHLPPEVSQLTPRTTEITLPRTWNEFKKFKSRIREAAVEELERRFLLDALRRCAGNVTEAAEEVGMQRTNFHALMKKHRLAPADQLAPS
jgi:DNA-binding NtrC family response regulator